MDKETATLIAAAVAAFAALFNTILTSWRQSRLEHQKWLRAKDDEQQRWLRARTDEQERWLRTKDDERERWLRTIENEQQKWITQRQDSADEKLRSTLAELARALAAGVQAMSWLTWKAARGENALTRDDITAYDKDMKAIFPQIVSGHLLVAAIDKSAGKDTKHLVESLYVLDNKIAQANLLFSTSPAEADAILSTYHDESDQLNEQLHNDLANIMYKLKASTAVKTSDDPALETV